MRKIKVVAVAAILVVLLSGCPGFEDLSPEDQLATLVEAGLTPDQQYAILHLVYGSNCPPFAQCPPEHPNCGGPASWTPLFFLLEDLEGDRQVILTPIYRLIHEWTILEMHGSLPCEVDYIEVAEDIPTF